MSPPVRLRYCKTWMAGTSPAMTERILSRPRRLLPIRQMHRATAPRGMRGDLVGIDVIGGHRGRRRVGRHCFLDAAVLCGLVLRGDVIQHRGQPAFGISDAPALARGVVLDLVALDL